MGSRESTTTVGAATTCEDERFGAVGVDGTGRVGSEGDDGASEWMDGWMDARKPR